MSRSLPVSWHRFYFFGGPQRTKNHKPNLNGSLIDPSGLTQSKAGPRAAPSPNGIDKIVNLGRIQLMRRLIVSWGKFKVYLGRVDITARYRILSTPNSNPGAVQLFLAAAWVFGCVLACGRVENL